jgi:glyoxylase-like metal-dependent hydrolase (beta-lactamase superfamily II)
VPFLLVSVILFTTCKKEEENMPCPTTSTPVDTASAEIDCPDVFGNPGPWDGSIWFDNWYAVEKVDCGTYIIAEPNGSEYNVNYLVVGTERAVLFDTGPGESNLAYLVDSLCNVPVTVLFSHFHYDHVGNIEEFENLAFIDLPYLHERADEEGNFTFEFDEVLASSPSEVQVDEWWIPGEAIDLGNREIELINIPGHTWESAAIIDRDRKYLFTGDYMYTGTLFAFLPGSDLTAYKQSAQLILNETDDEYVIFGAHSTPRNDRQKFYKLIDLLNCIADDSCTPSVFNIWGYVVYSYTLDGLTIWAGE